MATILNRCRVLTFPQEYFALFGAPVVAGRTFTTAEDSPHGGHVAVLSYGLWKSRYGADPKAVGTTIQLDGQPYLIVGVIGRGFVTDTPADLWVPFQFDLNSQDMAHYFTVAARLKPGVTLAQVNARLRLAADEYRRIYGKDSLPPDGGFGVVSLQEATIGDTRFPLLVLLGAVGFVLLIACANVANLLLARASSRKREFATRAALGAGRSQIIRQLLTESLTLSLAGGMLGLILGFGGVRFLLSINPGNIPRIGEDGSAVTLDANILLFTLGVSTSHRNPFWSGPRNQRLSTKSGCYAQRKRQPFRPRLSQWQAPLCACHRRNGPHSCACHWGSSAHPYVPQVAGCRSWLCDAQCHQHGHVDERRPLPEDSACRSGRS